jgi:hypothetical protein|tara:strand:+ start:1009 stop:1236 length:228 start_codon:yes stop_codon:yes gene_type:complete
MDKLKLYWEIANIGLIALATFLIIAIVLSLPLWVLWNWLMPYIFGLPTISIFQACGLSTLTNILFSSKLFLNEKN